MVRAKEQERANPADADSPRTYKAGPCYARCVLHFVTHYNYLLFHTMVELFGIFIVVIMTSIVFSCWTYIENRYIKLIGIAYLFIGALDLLHTLSYKGMPFFTDYDYYAPQFWIAARCMESVSILAGLSLVKTKMRINGTLVAAIYLAVTVWLSATILYYKTFPVCFVAGSGLTPFKIVSEYVICALFVVSILVLYARRTYFDTRIFHQLMTALALMVCMELCFTLYASDAMSDAFNEIGHLLKICAFWLVFQAIVVTALRDPMRLLFRELTVSEKRLREAQALARLGRWEMDVHTKAWTWTPEIYNFFSVAPSSPPSLDAMLKPLEPGDREKLRNLLSRLTNWGIRLNSCFASTRRRGTPGSARYAAKPCAAAAAA